MINLHLTPNDSINESLKSYPRETRITIYLSKGVYHEKVFLYHNDLTIIGESKDETIITYNDYSYKLHQDGLLYNTFRTSTVTVFGHHVHLHNLTIVNESGSGSIIGQAIALSLYGNHSKISHCVIDGNQDTLFIGPLPDDLIVRYTGFLPSEQLQSTPLHHCFNDCIIKGDVDFIFGSGTAFFNHCHIISKAKGFVCAPSTQSDVAYGFVFFESFIENKSKESIVLARPWREYGAVVFLNCEFKGDISENRFDDWDKNKMRFYETPYIQSPFSKPLIKEEKERLIKILTICDAAPNEKIKN